MTAQPLLCRTILMRVMTDFPFVLTQKRVMAPFNDYVLGLMRVMCRTRVTLLSFGTREYDYKLFLIAILKKIELIGGYKGGLHTINNIAKSIEAYKQLSLATSKLLATWSLVGEI